MSAVAVAQSDDAVAVGRVGSLAIPHSTEAVAIDGVLDDPIWRTALVLPLTIETYPRENQTPEVETTAYLVENGDQLLIAFDARDPDPESIRAYLRDRDSAFNDDFVGVVLDTFNDQRRAFEFFVNALGVQMDLIQDDVSRNESSSWNAIWDSAGEINSRGFTVEIAIPFSQLRFPSTAGDQTWGIDVLRFRPRAQRVRISNNPQDRNRNCYLCQFGKFTGFQNAEPGKALEVVPTLTATRTDSRATPGVGPLERGDFETEAGLGVRWGITPDLTLDATFNPDFSQVEADFAQLEENATFALFYPETRPFFLEGEDYYASPMQAVFTRTVADPDVGAKFTGRTGNNTIGMFATNDVVTNLLFPGPFGSRTTSLEQENDAFVGRYTRGFGRASTIGALVTSREGEGYSNEVAGFDGRYFMNDQSTLRFQYLDSRTEYPAAVAAEFAQAEELEGDAWRVEYRYGSRNWFAQVWHQDLDPTFRADSGFITRVDLVQDRFEFNRTFYGDPDDLVHGLPHRRTRRPIGDGGRPAHRPQLPALLYLPRADAVVHALGRRPAQGTLEWPDLRYAERLHVRSVPPAQRPEHQHADEPRRADRLHELAVSGPAAHPAADRLERHAPLARAPALYLGPLEQQGRADDLRCQAHGLTPDLAVQRAQLRAFDAARSGHRAQRRRSTTTRSRIRARRRWRRSSCTRTS